MGANGPRPAPDANRRAQPMPRRRSAECMRQLIELKGAWGGMTKGGKASPPSVIARPYLASTFCHFPTEEGLPSSPLVVSVSTFPLTSQ